MKENDLNSKRKKLENKNILIIYITINYNWQLNL